MSQLQVCFRWQRYQLYSLIICNLTVFPDSSEYTQRLSIKASPAAQGMAGQAPKRTVL